MRFIVTLGIFAAIAASWKLIPASQPTTGVLSVTNASTVPFQALPDGRFRGALMIRNDGPGNVRIHGVSPGCGCTKVTGFPSLLVPGESGQVVLEIDSTRASKSEFSVDPETAVACLRSSLSIKGSFAQDGIFSVNAFGTYELPVVVSPEAADLGAVSSASPPAAYSIPLEFRRPISRCFVVDSPRGIVASVINRSVRLEINPAEFASDSAKIIVLSVIGVNGDAVSVPVLLRMQVIPPLRTEPTRLVFGPCRLGQIVTRTVLIIPDGVSVGHLDNALIADCPFACGCDVRRVSRGLEVDVSMVAAQKGVFSDKVPMKVLQADGTENAMLLPVTMVTR